MLDRPKEDVHFFLKNYGSDQRLTVYRNLGIGLTENLNLGYEKALGKYIVRFDSDDVMTPSRIEKQVDFLENNLDYGAVGGAVIRIDEKSRLLEKIYYPSGNFLLKLRLGMSSPIAHSALTIRKEALVKAGGYFEEEFPAEDFGLLNRVGANWKMANLKDVVLYHRIHNESVSRQLNKEQLRKTLSIITNGAQPRKCWSFIEKESNRNWRFKVLFYFYCLLVQPLKIGKFSVYLFASFFPRNFLKLSRIQQSKRVTSTVRINYFER
jgi:glycosyltransferase involved in cell wall biosynthesis